MNYREKIRQAIKCPQFGDKDYGEWGALNLKQRKLIKKLLDELDLTDTFCKSILTKYSEKYGKMKELLEELKGDIDVDTECHFLSIDYLIERLEGILNG